MIPTFKLEAAQFFLHWILKRHHYERRIKQFSVASAKLIDFVWSKWQYGDFSTVRYTLWDPDIDIPQPVDSSKSAFSNLAT
jgi:hypothetical protein